MYEYIKGKLVQKNPAFAVIEAGGIGYHLNISLYTFEKTAAEGADVKLYTHFAVKEDAHTLFGFFDEAERALFRQLVGVSGIGPNTARMILSSLSPHEVRSAIINGNVPLLKSVKGIGAKSAQRIVVDLQDVMAKEGETLVSSGDSQPVKREAQAALMALGFSSIAAEKALTKAMGKNQELSVEELIKLALKNL